MDIFLRQARAYELNLLIDQIRNEIEPYVLSNRGTPYPEEEIFQQLRGTRIFVAEAQGRPVGLLAVRPLDKEKLYIEYLVVFKAFQNQGIGSQMLAHCEQIAQLEGYRAIELRVYPDNTGAQRLYTRTGYEAVENNRQDRYIRMVKSLHANETEEALTKEGIKKPINAKPDVKKGNKNGAKTTGRRKRARRNRRKRTAKKGAA